MKKLFSIIALCLVGTATNAQAPYAQFQGGMIGCIEPQGWIEEFLHRQQTGLTGHPEAMSYPYDSCLWAGEIGRNTETYGSDWWRYEQTAYYTDGLLRLGYLLGDREMIAKAEEGFATRWPTHRPQVFWATKRLSRCGPCVSTSGCCKPITSARAIRRSPQPWKGTT